jgi:hypothetical protein
MPRGAVKIQRRGSLRIDRCQDLRTMKQVCSLLLRYCLGFKDLLHYIKSRMVPSVISEASPLDLHCQCPNPRHGHTRKSTSLLCLTTLDQDP